jgi:hypothetical protein
MDDPHDYQEIPPDAEIMNFHVEDTALEKLITKTYERLTNAIRGAGVTTIFPTSGSGSVLFEEESLFRALAVEPGDALDACRAKAGERVLMINAHDEARRIFWSESDVFGSGLLWVGDCTLAYDVAETLIEKFVPSAAAHLIKSRQEPDDAIFTGLTEIEEVEMVAMVREMVDKILPGFSSAMHGGDDENEDEPEQMNLL